MRARNIKPGFFLNEQLSEIDFGSRLLFIGLWCYADREGRFEWIPKRIKAAIFPYDDKINIDKMLCNLLSLHVITRNDNIGYVEKFKKHQNPHPHEAKSSLPPLLEKSQSNQCHDMSVTLHVMSTKCNADSLIPDSLIPDIRKEDIRKLHQEIVDDLNEVLGTKYRSDTKDIQKLLKARLDDKFTLEDFKIVHRNMFQAWNSDPKMRDYLRPQTLYTEKFQGYLNKRPPTLSQQGIVSEKTERNIEVLNNWLAKEEAKDREASSVE